MSKATDEKTVGETEGVNENQPTECKAVPKVDYEKMMPWVFPVDNSERGSKTITVRFKGKAYKYVRGEQVMIPYKLYLMLKRKTRFARADRAYKAALEKKLKEIK